MTWFDFEVSLALTSLECDRPPQVLSNLIFLRLEVLQALVLIRYAEVLLNSSCKWMFKGLDLLTFRTYLG